MGFALWLSCLWIFFFVPTWCEKAPFTSFVKNAKLAASVEHYNYIVIGGGTAGCALATTLSASAKVLVLERGDLPYNNPNVTHMSGFSKSLLDTSPTSASQRFYSEEGVVNNRGRALGGSSTINAGFYSRASSEYVREAGWDARLVNESYEWVEQKLVSWPIVTAWQAGVRDGLLEAGLLPNRGRTYEHLIGTKIGGTTFDDNGYRHSAADLLEYADSTKITVYLHAVVHQIFVKSSKGKKPKAYGVLFKDSGGFEHVALLKDSTKNEIILSAGAIGSPQILMLSGIGPINKLKAQGINDIVLDQPLVGQGMVDNPINAVIIPTSQPLDISLVQTVGIDFGNYIETISGFVDFFSPLETTHYIQKATNEVIASSTKKRILETTEDSEPPPIPAVQAAVIFEKVKKPFSVGHLELRSKDPNDNPRVTFNYFQDPRDIESCFKGIEILRRVVQSRSLSTFTYPFNSFETYINLTKTVLDTRNGKIPTEAQSMEQYCKEALLTVWHYHGGCQVNRVIDCNYKVIGVDGLRVVDGSTFDESPGTNPQATCMMLGRYVGQKILQDRFSK